MTRPSISGWRATPVTSTDTAASSSWTHIQVENWWPATSTAPERTETEQALTLFADWEPDRYDLLD